MLAKPVRFLLLLFALALAAGVARNLVSRPSEIPQQLLVSLPLVVVLVLDLVAARRLRSERPFRAWRAVSLLGLLAVSAAFALYVGAVAYVDLRLADRTYEGVVNDPHKVWGARGLVLETSEIVKDGPQNTIESVTRAFDAGAKGCEIDVFFDAEMQHFVVSHDRPYHLKNGKLLLLEEMMRAVGQRGYVWLDFKKLRHLDDTSLAAAVAELQDLTQRHGDPGRMYVEGEDPIHLGAFRDAGFPTIYDTHPLADSHFVTPALINLYKLVYYFGDFSVMAMNYGEVGDPIYGERTKAALGDIPVFIYHVADDAEVLQALSDAVPVRSILVQNQSLDRYAFRAR